VIEVVLVRPHGIAFDLDGTLIDSRLDIAAACNEALRSAGRPTIPPEVIATYVGDGVRALVARAFSSPIEDPALDPHVEVLIRYYEAHPVAHTRWIPGALDALDAAGPLPLALITNKARSITLPVLDALGVRDRFASIYAGGDGPLKPDAAPVVACARALGVELDSLWVVGDGPQDVGAARAAGAVAVAVLGGFSSAEKLEAAKPDLLLSSMNELAARLRAG
jgi:phosphoglycolate phosphatase